MVVFLCAETFESILCAAYDAWDSGLGHKNIRIEFENGGSRELFCQYREVRQSSKKAELVMGSAKKRIGREAVRFIYEASLSKDEKRADWIYRFLLLGFHYGKNVVHMLQYEPVCRVFEMCRTVNNEAHRHLEFLRFSRTEDGILIGCIGPVNDILPLIAPHFSDRLPGENWIIYDKNRRRMAAHRANGPWILADIEESMWEQKSAPTAEEEEYRRLWRTFFTSIAVEARISPKRQRSNLPLRYREFMTEFWEE